MILLGTSLTLNFITFDPTTGAPADADSLPTIAVYEDANDTPILSPTAVKRSTGEYRVTVDVTAGNGFAVGHVYNVTAAATVSALVGLRVLTTFPVQTDYAVPGDPMTLTSGERDTIATALLDLADGVETNLTVRGSLRLALSALAAKVSGAAGPTVIFQNAVADSKPRITATVDASGNRTAITTDTT